jgi:phosphatidylserine/phosphatidylglycerophosphate/cardiolipin synthase-like enzyme
MRFTTPLAVALALTAGLLAKEAAFKGPQPTKDKDITVWFSPKGGVTDAIVEIIGSAKKSLDVQAYGFTSPPILKAIKDAHERGVKVRVLLDRSNRSAKYSGATYVLNAKVPTWIDAKHAIAHNKILLIDGDKVCTGSFNFSKSAEESNAENFLYIRDHLDLCRAYTANFNAHLEHSEVYTGPGKADEKGAGEGD